ncbi:MAG: hypothetical protein RPR28_07760 [Cycloclasticus sp.]
MITALKLLAEAKKPVNAKEVKIHAGLTCLTTPLSGLLVRLFRQGDIALFERGGDRGNVYKITKMGIKTLKNRILEAESVEYLNSPEYDKVARTEIKKRKERTARKKNNDNPNPVADHKMTTVASTAFDNIASLFEENQAAIAFIGGLKIQIDNFLIERANDNNKNSADDNSQHQLNLKE